MAVPVADIVAIVVEIAVLPVVQPIFQEESAFSSFDDMLLLICLYNTYFHNSYKVRFFARFVQIHILLSIRFFVFHFVLTSFFSVFKTPFFNLFSASFFNLSSTLFLKICFQFRFSIYFKFILYLFINNFRFIPIKDYLFFRKECLWFRKTKNG